jgi:acyl carrier protein
MKWQNDRAMKPGENHDDGQFDVRFDQILTRVFRLPQVPAGDTLMVDAGLDSLGFLGLLMELEDEFDNMWPVEYLTAAANGMTVAGLRKVAREVLWRGGN